MTSKGGKEEGTRGDEDKDEGRKQDQAQTSPSGNIITRKRFSNVVHCTAPILYIFQTPLGVLLTRGSIRKNFSWSSLMSPPATNSSRIAISFFFSGMFTIPQGRLGPLVSSLAFDKRSKRRSRTFLIFLCFVVVFLTRSTCVHLRVCILHSRAVLFCCSSLGKHCPWVSRLYDPSARARAALTFPAALG